MRAASSTSLPMPRRPRRVEVDVRHMGQAGDHDQRRQRVDVPGDDADDILDPGRDRCPTGPTATT